MDPLRPLRQLPIEKIQRPEKRYLTAGEQLEAAAEELASLYIGDLDNIALGTHPIQSRDELWRDLAEEYPDFADKILNLRKELREVPVGLLEGYFDSVKDQASRFLLGDLLYLRLGYSKDDQNIKRSETAMMLRELGIPKEKIGQALNIPIKLITSKILSDELFF